MSACVHLWSAPAPGWYVVKGRFAECRCHACYCFLRCHVERVTGARG